MTDARAVDAVTFEVAGLACRIECAYAKPILWVNALHPAFRSTRAPDVVVTVCYDDGYWARALPWIEPGRLRDAPAFAEHPDGALLRAAYYDAEIDHARRRVHARVAGGFGVGGLLRALYAVLLPSRGACLLRASMVPAGAGAALVCDDGEDAVVALIARGTGVEVEPTPFHDGTTPVRGPRRPVVAVDPRPGARPIDAAAQLLSRVVTVDHSAGTVESALDIVARLVAKLSAGAEVGAVSARH